MSAKETSRAKTYDDIAPLVELCKAGRLFDAQTWVAAGKPVNPPPPTDRRSRKKSPLEYAIELGFHSLVQVLLEAGAEAISSDFFCPMSLALSKRRFDIVELLVKHGFDAKSIDMRTVFSTWDPKIMEFFIERGADVESGMPLAWALCDRIRTALPVFKKYRDRFPTFQEQVNVALRHQCKEGNQKWISLLLWAGADPLARGEAEPGTVPSEEDHGISALAFAALYHHFEIFSMKKIKLQIDHPAMQDVLNYCCEGEGLPIVERLLAKGMNPNNQENGGCAAIQQLLDRLEWCSWSVYGWERRANGIDCSKSRDHLKAIHLLAKYGGKWRPVDSRQLNAARRSLLRMTPDYTIEFVWIMSKFQASSRSDIEALVRTPTMKRHLAPRSGRLAELLSGLPTDGPSEVENNREFGTVAE